MINCSSLRKACLAPATIGALLLAACASSVAAPGAHGPNGEHLDGPAIGQAGPARPRIEARSELFELVAELENGELTILVDRYETNEPVLGAKVIVESGALQATAAFRVEQGDYVVSDAALVKTLATAGQHAVVFTVEAGDDADLLDGTMTTPGAAGSAHDHGHSHTLERLALGGAGILGAGLIAFVAMRLRRRQAGAGLAHGAAK
jgi:hypothetical protein